jgi:hypothetical protein
MTSYERCVLRESSLCFRGSYNCLHFGVNITGRKVSQAIYRDIATIKLTFSYEVVHPS